MKISIFMVEHIVRFLVFHEKIGVWAVFGGCRRMMIRSMIEEMVRLRQDAEMSDGVVFLLENYLVALSRATPPMDDLVAISRWIATIPSAEVSDNPSEIVRDIMARFRLKKPVSLIARKNNLS